MSQPSYRPYPDIVCENCGRERVLFDGVCEKCRWNQDTHEYEPQQHAAEPPGSGPFEGDNDRPYNHGMAVLAALGGETLDAPPLV